VPPGVTEEISGHGKLSHSAHYAPVAQRIEHPPPKRGAASSILAGRETSLLEGLAPLELPRTRARGAPAIPAPRAWLTRCARSHAISQSRDWRPSNSSTRALAPFDPSTSSGSPCVHRRATSLRATRGASRGGGPKPRSALGAIARSAKAARVAHSLRSFADNGAVRLSASRTPARSLQVCEPSTSSRPSLTLVGTCCARR
jgi:hypothetical protein